MQIEGKLGEEVALVAPAVCGGKRKYHYKESCQHVNDGYNEWDLDMAKSWFDGCVKCVPEPEQ